MPSRDRRRVSERLTSTHANTIFVVELPHAPDMRSNRDTAVRSEHASGASWKVVLAIVALTVIAVIVVVVITT
jgi:hypothetical protein